MSGCIGLTNTFPLKDYITSDNKMQLAHIRFCFVMACCRSILLVHVVQGDASMALLLLKKINLKSQFEWLITSILEWN